jgi:hypothetical protein
LSTYYARYDMQKRYAFFYLIGTLCNGLSGVLAYGIQQMVSVVTSFTDMRWSLTRISGWYSRLQRVEMDIHP